jgi:hypothetical protein
MSSETTYEAVYAYLSRPSYDSGMEAEDFLRLLTALLHTEHGIPTGDRLAQLAYHLNDGQRQALQQLAAAANRLDDAAIAAEIGLGQFRSQWAPRFGASNPEQMNMPFWVFMVQRGWKAYQARDHFERVSQQQAQALQAPGGRKQRGKANTAKPQSAQSGAGYPIWCFDRFGMALVRLPDGRALFIAGEHEDFYDSDFCIYNDVIVLDHALQVTIYGYPKAVFPPTDFHSATLVDGSVYIIGNLGYADERQAQETPVYALDTDSMAISRIATSGAKPGWISNHHAQYDSARNAIIISGGQIFMGGRGPDSLRHNRQAYALDLSNMQWSLIDR